MTDIGVVPGAVRSVVARPARTVVAPEANAPSRGAVLDLLHEVGVCVGGLGLAEDARWVAASGAVAATAATMRAAVIEMTAAVDPRPSIHGVDGVAVRRAAPPVVRAREIGFLAARLAVILGQVYDEGHDRQPPVALLVETVADRLAGDVCALRQALGVGA